MIEYSQEPSEGLEFEFDISPEPGEQNISIVASIADRTIYEKHSDCDDPPCHEMFQIPQDSAGQELQIRYESSREEQTITLNIKRQNINPDLRAYITS